jgi:galactokinase
MPSTVTARAPGRVNLIGEHLDYNGGLCLPIAIPQSCTVTAALRDDDLVHLRSGNRTWAGRVSDHPTGWPAYCLGVLDALGVPGGVSLAITSDVPGGAGLSSSAALVCSVALAVDAVLELRTPRDALLAATIQAENDYVGVPTGGLDQTISLGALAAHALLLDFGTGEQTPVPFDPAADGIALVVINTGVRHALVDGAYAARRADCEAASKALRLEHLAWATPEQIDGLPGGRVGRRARHVATEQARVRAFVEAVQGRAWAAAGALMVASHTSLRDDYEVSCPELDTAVEQAVTAGALGARMTGGGFGGSAIALVPAGAVASMTAQIQAAYAENGWDAPTCFEVEASRGAEVLAAT